MRGNKAAEVAVLWRDVTQV